VLNLLVVSYSNVFIPGFSALCRTVDVLILCALQYVYRVICHDPACYLFQGSCAELLASLCSGPTLLIDQDLMDSIPNDSPQAIVAVRAGTSRLLVAVHLSSCAIKRFDCWSHLVVICAEACMPGSLADVPGLCDKSCDIWFYICTKPQGMPMITVLLLVS